MHRAHGTPLIPLASSAASGQACEEIYFNCLTLRVCIIDQTMVPVSLFDHS